MTSKEETMKTHDMMRESGNGERRHIIPGSLPLDFHTSTIQPMGTITVTASTTATATAAAAATTTIPVEIDQEILELRKQQELQKQMLVQTFQEQQKKLDLQHKLQLEHKYQYAVHSHGAFQELQDQRLAAAAAVAAAAAAEQEQQQQHQQHQQQQQQQQQAQRERREREILCKRKENCSANASPQVKQILNNFIINRKQAASSNGLPSTSPYRNRGVVKSSSGEALPAGTVVASSHPYKIPQVPQTLLLKCEDFPLRKTASEPNLLKIRLKQSVIERKARISGPAGVRRQERLLQAAQRRQQKQNSILTNSNSTPDSGPNSPPSSSTLSATSMVGSRGSPTSAPIQEENEEGSQYQPTQRSSINDLSLFSSPSMPNISLGRPHLSNAASAHYNYNFALALNSLNQHAVAAAASGGGGGPGSLMAAAGGPTYYNPLAGAFGRQPAGILPPGVAAGTAAASIVGVASPSSVVRSASGTSTSSSQTSLVSDIVTGIPPQAHAASSPNSLMQITGGGGGSEVAVAAGLVMGPAGSMGSQTIYGHPITDAQVAQAHLYKQGHRPLGRTQSAPLPLGHPMLTGSGQINIAQTHYENSDAERQAYERSLLTQKLRQTVLTRSGALREPQLKEEEDAAEVMDLTDKKKPPKTVLVATNASQSLPETSTVPLPPTPMPSKPSKLRDIEYLQQQRELIFMQALQADEGVTAAHTHRLSRTLSSPLVHLGPHGVSQTPDTGQHHSPIATSSSADHIPPVNLSLPQKRHFVEYATSVGASGIPHHPAHHHLYSPPAALSMTTATEFSLKLGGGEPHKITTGLAYDNLMLKHTCICGNNAKHPEHSGRLQSVWARLNETDLAKRCDRLRCRKATLEELKSIHTDAHAVLFGSNPCQLKMQRMESMPSVSFVRLPCGGVGVDLDTTWNEQHTAAAARMAAGCVIDLAFKTAKGDIKNGFAVVRPPGHHAETNLAMGFCFFNSVAIAAKLLRQCMPIAIKRILIVDWDVHHGNGTQQAFYDCSDVLYLSIHRHDDGNFFPGTGGPTDCGVESGLGYNVNISWSGGLNPPLGDAEYIAAFRTVVMPIAKSFNPDLILVSAGFDAAAGHPAPLGGYLISPACFGFMTRELMQLASGRVVLALEGGYDLPATCDSAEECVRALLGDQPTPIEEGELNRRPCQNAIDTLQKTIAIQSQNWPCVRRLAQTVGMSAMEALKFEHDESETVTAMAGLSMQSMHRNLSRDDSEEPMDQDDMK